MENLIILLGIQCEKDEEILEHITAKVKNLKSFKKKYIFDVCEALCIWAVSLQHETEKIVNDFEHYKVIFGVNLETSLKEKEKIEENYTSLLNNHQNLEVSLKTSTQKTLHLENEIRELKLKLENFQLVHETLEKNFEDQSKIISEKEKIINDLSRKLKINNSINIIKELHYSGQITSPKQSYFSRQSLKKTSITPREKIEFTFEKTKTSNISEEIIKNLTTKLNDYIERFEKTNEKCLKFQQENRDLQERIKFLTMQNYEHLEFDYNEDDLKFETVETLRDEFAAINHSVSSKSSFPVKALTKEIGVQYHPVIDRKKARFSCFSFFSS